MLKPLKGWQVLVPRGGDWGQKVAGELIKFGARAVVVPLINFSPALDQESLKQRFAELSAGAYDWLVVTSATTVDVMTAMKVTVPPQTKIAAVGEATALGLNVSGYPVDFIPAKDYSGRAIVREFPNIAAAGSRILLAQSEIADPQLAAGLVAAGVDVTPVIAYRTLGVAAGDEVRQAVADGDINGILITSGSVATQVKEQFSTLPGSTKVVCIGPKTALDTTGLGLPVHAIAKIQATESLIESLLALAGEGASLESS